MKSFSSTLAIASAVIAASTAIFSPSTASAYTFDSSAFADEVVNYDRGESRNWNSFSGDANGTDPRWQVYDPTAVLGEANWTAEMTQRGRLGQWDRTIGTSLGRSGSITVEFTDNYLVGSGDDGADLWIFEIGAKPEQVNVAISTDNETWYDAGLADRQDATNDHGIGLDIDWLINSHEELTLESFFRYVKVTDANNNRTNGYGGFKSGADLDAIAAISNISKSDKESVPEPTSLAALVAVGLASLSVLKKRK